MVKKFLQLKRKAVTAAVLYALLTGVFAAALVFGGIFLFIKRTDYSFPWWGYLLTCLGVFLFVGGTVIAFRYPTTKRFSKYLDEEFALGERVRTSIEYDGRFGAILELQRQQTQERLFALPERKKTVWWWVKALLLPVLAVATVTTSIAVPSKSKPAEKEPVFTPQAYNVIDLETLMKNVQSSTLSADMKGVYDGALSPLLTLIKSPSPTYKEVIATVNGAAQLIISATKEHNTYAAIASAAKEKTELKSMVDALEHGAACVDVGVNVASFADIKGKAESVGSFAQTEWEAYAVAFGEKLRALDESAYVPYATAYIGDIDEVLDESGVAATDGLALALVKIKTALGTSLTQIADPSLGMPFVTAKNNAISLIGETYNLNKADNAAAPLGEQAYALLIKRHAIGELERIFGIIIPDGSEDEGGGSVGDDEGNSGGGGGGTGETVYPNDGEVLYPGDGGRYEEYGKVLNEYGYYQEAMDLIDENTEISEEMKEWLREYFSSLQSNEN